MHWIACYVALCTVYACPLDIPVTHLPPIQMADNTMQMTYHSSDSKTQKSLVSELTVQVGTCQTSTHIVTAS